MSASYTIHRRRQLIHCLVGSDTKSEGEQRHYKSKSIGADSHKYEKTRNTFRIQTKWPVAGRSFVAGHDAVGRKRNQVDTIELVGAIMVFSETLFIIDGDLLHALGVYIKSVKARKFWHCSFGNYC